MALAASLHPLGLTGLWVAALRAIEQEREDALFRDPFARTLAGALGFETHERCREASAAPFVEVRTRFFDDKAMAATRAGLDQVALLGAGMDTRAFRLSWPEGTRLFEIDRPEVLAYKAAQLGDAAARCDRRMVPVDLEGAWQPSLMAAGFDPRRRTLWIVEGLLIYLPELSVRALLRSLGELAQAPSTLLCDIVGTGVLELAVTKAAREVLQRLGVTYRFGTDEPEALLSGAGWGTSVERLAEVATRLGRWPFPLQPRRTPGIPDTFLIEATRN